MVVSTQAMQSIRTDRVIAIDRLLTAVFHASSHQGQNQNIQCSGKTTFDGSRATDCCINDCEMHQRSITLFLLNQPIRKRDLVMGQSIANTYATRMEAINTTPTQWKWPQPRNRNPILPDPRLLGGSITGLKAELRLGNGTIVDADVRAVSQHDLVLVVDDAARVPVNGQVLEVSLCLNGNVLLTDRKSILHWSGLVSGDGVIALFTIEPMGVGVEKWMSTGERGEIRFPIDVPAVLQISEEVEAFGRMIDYSLSGCRFHCIDEVELGNEYKSTVLFPHSTVDVSVTPRWVLNSEGGYQLGCSFQPEQGVLMACRYHPQPSGLSSPLKPQTTNWNGRQS